jgi:hypothetical protein
MAPQKTESQLQTFFPGESLPKGLSAGVVGRCVQVSPAWQSALVWHSVAAMHSRPSEKNFVEQMSPGPQSESPWHWSKSSLQPRSVSWKHEPAKTMIGARAMRHS